MSKVSELEKAVCVVDLAAAIVDAVVNNDAAAAAI